jgi:hypothetical protein
MCFQRTLIGGRELSALLRPFGCFVRVVIFVHCIGLLPAWAAPATTTTALSVTSAGNAVATVTSGTVVTLTATVTVGSNPVTPGQINFCDAAADHCTDIHLLGTAQLTTKGTAALYLRPGIGSHSYKAVFLGTLDAAASASAAIGLTVGPRPPGPQTTYTVASISGPVATNTYGTYALTANIGTKGAVPPSGTVSFSGRNVATGNSFSLPGTATLGPVSGGTGFLNVPIPVVDSGLADAPPIVAIGDFNGDGIPDIVSAPHGGIAVSLGNGDGTFAAPLIPKVDSADGINAFGVGDFNGDGITDLLIDDEDTSKLTVLLGKGDGTFTVGQSMPYSTTSLAVADFNGDGKLDIALPGNILLGNGDGTFTAAANPPAIPSLQVVAADFNGDDKIDLALIGFTNAGDYTPFAILLGNGDGTFTAAPNQPQFVASQLVAADFNGDGKIDLAALNPMGDSVTILLGNGDGTFAAPSTLPTDPNFRTLALAVGDFNGDGNPDVAVAVSSNTPGGGGKVSIFAGKGDGTFADGFDVALVAGSLTSLAAADLTGSGSSDLSTFGSVFLGNLTITTATADNVLPAGGNVIQADYPGDANNAPSSSTNAPSVLVPQQPFSLTSNPVTVTPGASASGSFTVTSEAFTGTLNLSCWISAPQSQANPPVCSVQPTVNFFSPGGTDGESYVVSTQATTLTGQYSITITAQDTVAGTTVSTSAAVSVGAQNYLLTNSGATIASPGASGNSTITISPVGGYTGQITMTCAVSGGPSGAVNSPGCTIPSPISVMSSPVTTTLTLNTQPTTSPGSYTVTVTAASAGSLNAITSFAVNVPAVPTAPPGFMLSSTAVTIAAPGPNGTSTITISPRGGFTGTVALSCAVSGGPIGAADAPTCSVTAPPAITGASAVTATLIISTTAASSAAQASNSATVSVGGGVIFSALLVFGVPSRKRRWTTLFLLLLFATVAGMAVGCGAGANASKANVNPGTAPGNYTVTVTGVAGTTIATTAVAVTVN